SGETRNRKTEQGTREMNSRTAAIAFALCLCGGSAMATGESRIYQFDIPMEVVREEAVPLANSPREIDPTTDTRLGKNADGNAVQNDKTIKTFKTARPDAVAKLAPADPWTRRMLAYRDALADREYGHFVLGGEPMREGDRGKR